jgi:asparagine synthase (glutamine-hydrolysing)
MCGIAGCIATPERGKSSRAELVLKSIEHRGPDDAGWLRLSGGWIEKGHDWNPPATEPDALLLHRRLSIIDTTVGGWQPMSTADGRYHIVYNGEIYNYREIRVELEQLGHRFHSASDTEVLLEAYAEWGTNAFRRFVGMFAFAILDTQHRTLLLARDFFGIKPLYYWAEEGCLSFGSEIKALFAFGLSEPHANTERLLSYLRYGVTDFGAETMLAEVCQIPAAHFMMISLEDCRPQVAQCYWTRDSDPLDVSFDEAAATVRDLFLGSVQLHLRSDVAVGSALSGGIDSSAIVTAIRHLDSKAEIHAFSYISETGAPSEEHWVDAVVRQVGAHVHKVYATDRMLAEDLRAMMDFCDEPFGSTSAYAQSLVFRAAHEAGVKVMLDGQGADEILGGYDTYKGARLASLVRQGRWSQAIHFLKHLSPQDGVGKYLGIAYCADFLLPPGLQAAARSLAGKDAFPLWLNRRWFADRGVGARFANYTGERNVLRHSLDRSVRETLPGLLRYEDRNSMANSVESRVPFLTPQLVTYLGRLPESYLIDENGTSKAVFRAAMRGIVPDAILNRRDKIGFATPEKSWMSLMDSSVRSTLDGDAARGMGFLNLSAARTELDAVREGNRPFGFHVWRWINLIRWTEQLGVVYS